jgi:16S rRNA (guanine(966)-N(2))-methyltransferase RsmD
VRIIGGAYKGKQIVADHRLTLRPTTDFAKEGLFNILSNRFDVSSFEALDMFAGTGSISYEFASRGCANIHAVEIDPRHVAFIRATAGKLGFSQIRVIRDDVFHFLSICKRQYDIIFADPPYNMPRTEEIPDLVLKRDILKPDGILILEHSRQNDFSGHGNMRDHRRYGNVHFSFFKREI